MDIFDFGHKKKNARRDGDLDEFAFDHVMGPFNGHESFRADHDPVTYQNPRTKPRQKTRAGEVLSAIDGNRDHFNEPMDDLALGNLAWNMGTDPDFARAYNEADPAAKEDMKWNQAEADKWWDSASPEEIADQYDAAKEAKAYDIGRKSIDWGIDYTDADTRNDYADINNLHPGKFKQFLYGAPDERRDVIRETNARLQPWNPKWTETDNALLEPAPSPNAYASDALAPPHNSWTEEMDGVFPSTNNLINRNEVQTISDLPPDGSEAKDYDLNGWRPGKLTPVEDTNPTAPDPMETESRIEPVTTVGPIGTIDYKLPDSDVKASAENDEALNLANASTPPKTLSAASTSRKAIYDPDTERALDELRHKESSGNYKIVNSKGYLGAYQMGNLALVDAGLKETVGKDSAGKNIYAWTGKYGIHSQTDFLNNPYAQDRAVMDFFKALKRQLNSDKNGASEFIGMTIDGINGKIKITLDALILAGHRRGAKAVSDYLHYLQERGMKSDPEMSEPFKEIETRLREFANSIVKVP